MMWELFQKYKNEVKSKPILKHTFVGKEGRSEYSELERPLTMEGFNNYVFTNGIAAHLDNYFANLNNKYRKYLSICRTIKEVIRQDQIEGGMAGIYNPSITQRLNNLVDRQQVEHIEQPLFSDDEEIDE